MKRKSLLFSFLVLSFLAPSLFFAANMPVKPYKFQGNFLLINIQWADPSAPLSGATSYFEGRCTELSDYVITFGLVGEATHLGRVTGMAEHCSQLHLTGPGNVTYKDGQFSIKAANGDMIIGTYGNGTSGADANGVLWFHDFWTITGGTGRFLSATGSGEEGGTASDFIEVLNGAPFSGWMEGTIAYRASDRR